MRKLKRIFVAVGLLVLLIPFAILHAVTYILAWSEQLVLWLMDDFKPAMQWSVRYITGQENWTWPKSDDD